MSTEMCSYFIRGVQRWNDRETSCVYSRLLRRVFQHSGNNCAALKEVTVASLVWLGRGSAPILIEREPWPLFHQQHHWLWGAFLAAMELFGPRFSGDGWFYRIVGVLVISHAKSGIFSESKFSYELSRVPFRGLIDFWKGSGETLLLKRKKNISFPSLKYGYK